MGQVCSNFINIDVYICFAELWSRTSYKWWFTTTNGWNIIHAADV